MFVAMPCVPSLRFGSAADLNRPEAGEVMSGVLEIVRSPNDSCQRVFVRVYRTSSEHFAVLCPVRGVLTACRPLASLNLRSCTVEILPGGAQQFRVTARACEGVALTFRLPEGERSTNVEDRSVKTWLAAFRSDDERTEGKKRKVSDHKQMLPVLVESEQEEESEEHRI